jgi:hypothetical protein
MNNSEAAFGRAAGSCHPGSGRLSMLHPKVEPADQEKPMNQEKPMSGLRVAKVVVGLCVALGASSAWADSSPFVGRWHWNRAQSTMPPGEPVPNDVTAEISRADGAHLTWSLTIVASQGQPNVESFDAPANGEFYPVSSDTTAAFRLTGSALQGTFKGPTGQTDDLTCTIAADQKKMTCSGVLSDGKGHTMNYADVYDRM